jgi:hypothetical protein
VLPIDLPTRAELETPNRHRGAPAVSLHLRTTPRKHDAQADRIALRNHLREAVAQMEGARATTRDIRAIEAAVEALASVFAGLSSSPHLAAGTILGSADHTPDHTPDHALAAAARQALDGLHAAEFHALAGTFAQRATQGRATSDIAQAARARTCGTVGAEDGALTTAAAADGTTCRVTDEIAHRALRSGARVLSARRGDIPGGGQFAAILRYPVCHPLHHAARPRLASAPKRARMVGALSTRRGRRLSGRARSSGALGPGSSRPRLRNS